MGVKVKSVSIPKFTTNQATGTSEQIATVVFIEERGGTTNVNLEEGNTLIAQYLGNQVKQVGLKGTRSHSQPMVVEAAEKFRDKIHKDFGGKSEEILPFFIIRSMESLPVMNQQNMNKDSQKIMPQNINGRPTFFSTKLSDREEPDVDNRMTNSELAKFPVGIMYLQQMITQKTTVESEDENRASTALPSRRSTTTAWKPEKTDANLEAEALASQIPH